MTKIIAITGPTGSGKTTTASLLAQNTERCVNIDADHVKHFIVSGFIYNESAEVVEQWELLGKNIGQLVKNFQDAGYTVIINGYINEPAWNEIYEVVDVSHKFLLLPEINKVAERDEGRAEEVKMGKEAVLTHHKYFSTSDFFNNFTKIDSTDQTVEQTVEQILNLVS